MDDERSRAGFSLVELVISLTLLALILGALFGSVVQVQRAFTRQQAKQRAQEALRSAEMVLSTVLRSAGADPTGTGRTLLDPDPRNTGTFSSVRVVSDFNPPDTSVAGPLEDVLVFASNDTLFIRWDSGGTVQPMAWPIDSLLFEYFDRSNTLLSTRTDVAVSAQRVRLTLVAVTDPRAPAAERRVSWIYMRNR